MADLGLATLTFKSLVGDDCVAILSLVLRISTMDFSCKPWNRCSTIARRSFRRCSSSSASSHFFRFVADAFRVALSFFLASPDGRSDGILRPNERFFDFRIFKTCMPLLINLVLRLALSREMPSMTQVFTRSSTHEKNTAASKRSPAQCTRACAANRANDVFPRQSSPMAQDLPPH